MIIETPEEHAVMLELLDDLMTKTPGSLAIAVVGKVIEQYELAHFPIPEPTPEEAAAFRREEGEPICREKGHDRRGADILRDGQFYRGVICDRCGTVLE